MAANYTKKQNAAKMKTIEVHTVANGALPGYYLEYRFSGIAIGIAPTASPTAQIIENGFRAEGYEVVAA